MDHRRNRLLVSVAALLGVILLVGALAGCDIARRPGPPEQAPPEARQALPNDPREAGRLADRLAKTAADTPGVNRATVVLTGTTAYVGLNLEEGMEGKRTNEVKRKAAKRVRQAEPRIERVMVTTDMDTFARLERIAAGVRRGEPVSAFQREFAEINRRSTPITR